MAWGGPQKSRRQSILIFSVCKCRRGQSAIQGFRRSLVLVRELGEETEIVTITFFERLEDVVAFAGDRYEIANVSPEARGILSR